MSLSVTHRLRIIVEVKSQKYAQRRLRDGCCSQHHLRREIVMIRMNSSERQMPLQAAATANKSAEKSG
jgi:hypothetical protein